MNLLILGGTRFLGRAIAEEALRRGHNLTLFNRGQSGPNLFPEAVQLRGERGVDVSALAQGSWDAVIDPSAYVPRIVRESAGLLRERVGQYIFISSLSVYADPSQPGIREDAPLGVLADETVEEITGDTYGPLKVLSERAAEETLPGRVAIVRPGLIVGPHDPTDRFTYWPIRVAEGGAVLAPGQPERLVQFIDVRDLAAWIVALAERGQTGVFNANGPAEPTSMGSLLETCRAVSGSDARLEWVSEEFLEAQQVGPWMELPLWLPESDPSTAGFFAFDSSRAVQAGLTFRPAAETVAATLAWARTRPAGYSWRAGLTRDRELELLELWRQQK